MQAPDPKTVQPLGQACDLPHGSSGSPAPLPDDLSEAKPKDTFLSGRKPRLLVCLLLIAATVAVYWRVAGYGLIGIDDHVYFGENAHVLAGLTWHNVAWAFHTTMDASWYPLSWLSFMLDAELFGRGAMGPHLTNMVLHVANCLLLFLLLERLTGSFWRSACVAGLFALHPLHVESVAWVSERKDVLSTFFGLLTLLAYARYAARATEGFRRGAPAYLLALLFFALGLLSKPMLVTLPFVMLLLDYWPLERTAEGRMRNHAPAATTRQCGESRITFHVSRFTFHPPRFLLPLLLEKVPFLLLSVVASIITVVVHKQAGAIAALTSASIPARIENAFVSYARYLGKTFWPVNLGMPYLYSGHWPLGLVSLGVALVVGLSAAALWLCRRRPYFFVGWFWFLGTLVPVIGLVQWGNQAMADRFMYVPSIGLFLALTWGLGDVLARWRWPSVAVGSSVALMLFALAFRCRDQVGYWRDSEAFFRHTLAVTSGNYVACDCLGSALDRKGKHDEAMRYLSEAVRLEPRYPEGQYDLGTALLQEGKPDEAERHLSVAVKYNPGFPDAYVNRSKARLQQGNLDEAAADAAKAVQLAPDDPEAQYNLGTLRLLQAKPSDAIACFAEAVRLRPAYAAAQGNLGVALMRQGKRTEGFAHLSTAVRLEPANPEAHDNLGLALLELNHPHEAIAQFTEAVRLNPNSPGVQYHLAEALVREAKPQAARPHAEKARDLAQAADQPALAAKAKELLKTCQ